MLQVLLLLVLLGGLADAGETNLVANPDFLRTYRARRLTAPGLKYVRGQHKTLPSYDGEAFLPAGWLITLSADGAGRLSFAPDGDRRALRVRTGEGQVLTLTQRYVEVAPGAEYDFGVQVKGAGHVRLSAYASNPGPAQRVGEVSTKARGDAWETLGFSQRMGWHRHLAEIAIRVSAGADVLLRGASVTA